MGDHAKHSPSSAHRWLECPGSIAACEGLPDNDNVWSREGTFAHHIAAMALEQDKPASAFLGQTDGEFTVDEEMAGHVQTYLDVVEGIRLISDGKPKLLVEQRVTASKDVYGTSDAIIVAVPILHVVDLKYGAGAFVAADENEQAMIYAIGAWKGLGRAARDKVTHVHLHIVQPRRRDVDDRAHRTCVLTIAELLAFEERVLAGVEASKKPDAPLASGSWCQFCLAKPTCPRLRADALGAAVEVFKDGDDLSQPVAPPVLATIPAERLAEILAAADRVESWIDGVRKHALERARTENIPGYKVVAKIGNRRWKDDTAAASMLEHAGVFPFEPQKVISPAAAEKKLGKRAASALVDPMTERLVTGAALVPTSDKRPALNAGDVFPELS